MRRAALALALAVLFGAAPAGAAVRVAPVGIRPHGTLHVHVTGRLPETLSIDGRRVATIDRATTRVSLRKRFAEGRHRLRACRGRVCSTGAPFVVTNGPIVAGCPVFPADSAWNTDISHAPLAPESATLVGAQAAGHDVHLDFGDTQSEYGIPYSIVGPAQRRVPITYGTDGADYGDESDQGRCPSRPARRSKADGPRDSDPDVGDRHVHRVQQGAAADYELYNAVRGNDERRPGVVAAATTSRERPAPAGWTSADAAGLPIFPGLLRYDEAACRADPARPPLHRAERAARLRRRLASARGRRPTRPHRRTAPRLRLTRVVHEAPYRGPALAIVRALKRYGLIFADQGSAMFTSGTSDARGRHDRATSTRPPDPAATTSRSWRGRRPRSAETLAGPERPSGRDGVPPAPASDLLRSGRPWAPPPRATATAPTRSETAACAASRTLPGLGPLPARLAKALAGQVTRRVPPADLDERDPDYIRSRCRGCG